jgi:hypothetical protein
MTAGGRPARAGEPKDLETKQEVDALEPWPVARPDRPAIRMSSRAASHWQLAITIGKIASAF